MVESWELWALAFLGLLAWWWYDSMRAREQALGAAREACRRDGLQLLDETVECVRTRQGRNAEGRFALRRTYRFEFTDTGDNRREGSVVLLGPTVESLTLEPFLAH